MATEVVDSGQSYQAEDDKLAIAGLSPFRADIHRSVRSWNIGSEKYSVRDIVQSGNRRQAGHSASVMQ